MRIGILTLPQETNYGGILQAFAMQRFLNNLGHEAITIDRHKRKQYPSLSVHIAGFIKRLYMHHVLRRKAVSTKWNPFISDEAYKAESAKTQAFIKHNMKMTRWVFTDQLSEIDQEYQFDAYVVGSDQVWLDYYCPSSFLDFVRRPNVRKVTYAASCGRQSFFNNSAKVAICRELVKSFNGISVREESLLQLCKDKLGIEAQWVIDPTMLLMPDDYLAATDHCKEPIPIVFSYILDGSSEKNAVVNAIAELKKLPVVNGNRVSAGADKVFPSVDDWIQNINRSKFVMTDSFHGTVFAILFNKPFISLGNVRRGMARFESLLGMFGLRNRLITDIQIGSILKLANEPIDFDMVNKKLAEEREKALRFINISLGDLN